DVPDRHLDVAVGLDAGGNRAVNRIGDVLVGAAKGNDLHAFRWAPLFVDLHRGVVEHPSRPNAWDLEHGGEDGIHGRSPTASEAQVVAGSQLMVRLPIAAVHVTWVVDVRNSRYPRHGIRNTGYL